MESAFTKFRILFWAASVSILIFSYYILKKDKSSTDISGFLLYSGVLTALILFDDIFLIHHFFRKVLHIKNTFFYLIYPIGLITIVILYFKKIRETNSGIILFAIGFLGLGVVLDLLSDGRLLRFS